MKGNKILYLILLITFSIFFTSCVKKDGNDKLYSEKSYTIAQLMGICINDLGVIPVLPDYSYQLVNKNGLKAFYKQYSEELFSKDVVKWESNFDCNRFSQYYAALAQIMYYKENFRSNRAKAIAIGEVYFYSERLKSNHAINFALTDSGFVFIEPQTGEEIILTDTEKKSIFFIKL